MPSLCDALAASTEAANLAQDFASRELCMCCRLKDVNACGSRPRCKVYGVRHTLRMLASTNVRVIHRIEDLTERGVAGAGGRR